MLVLYYGDYMRKFAVFDIDGTLIRWQLYHAVVEAIAKPSPDTLAAIKEARIQWKNRAQNDAFKVYEEQIIKIFESMLSDLDPDELSRAVSLVFDKYKDQVYTYTRGLITRLKKEDYLLFAISGSNIEIVEQIAQYYSFDDFVATVFEKKQGHFTGKVKLARFNKHLAVQKLADRHNATFEGSIGVGDSYGDASFLEIVEHPIAFNPDRELLNVAQKQGWKVVIERKNVVYELESRDGTYVLAKAEV